MIDVGDEYLQARVMTASPWRLHLMVIDEMLKHARRAREAILQKNFETSHQETTKAREFLTEVLSGVRDDISPELGRNVKEYFLHIQKYLFLADMQQNADAATRAIELIEGYRETWIELQNHLAEPV